MLVAAASAGTVAIVTFVLAREYRTRNLNAALAREVQVALALAPSEVTDLTFDRLRRAYEERTEADLLVVQSGRVFSTSLTLDESDIPAELRSPELRSPEERTPEIADAQVDGRHMRVAAAQGRGEADYFVFFSLRQLEQSLSELAAVAAAGWVLTVILSGAVGHLVARRTLRPVAATAEAAESIAAGDLDTRLTVGGPDEFGALAASFNHMADELQRLIDQLHAAAWRERRFTADVAHELRTPLTGMSASADVLTEHLDDLPVNLHRPAALLLADVTRLRDLVLDLLELSRLDAATEPVRAEPLRVVDAVEAVIMSTNLRRRATVAVDIDAGLTVMAEPRRLARIMGNLIDNAVRHGAGSVHVEAKDDGDHIVVTVRDEGPGIQPEEAGRIFDRFYKSDESRASGGSGLGLAIALEHAVAQGGSLTVGNASTGGACFSVRLPTPGSR